MRTTRFIIAVDSTPPTADGKGQFQARIFHEPSMLEVSNEPQEWENRWHSTPADAIRAAVRRCEDHPLLSRGALEES